MDLLASDTYQNDFLVQNSLLGGEGRKIFGSMGSMELRISLRLPVLLLLLLAFLFALRLGWIHRRPFLEIDLSGN